MILPPKRETNTVVLRAKSLYTIQKLHVQNICCLHNQTMKTETKKTKRKKQKV